MKRLIGAGNVVFTALALLASVLAVNAPSEALAMGGHGSAGGHGGGVAAHQGFDGHHFDGHFDRGVHGRAQFGFGAVPYYGYYPDAPAYWYYCPSYGAYYPNVESCPEAWVPVPAS